MITERINLTLAFFQQTNMSSTKPKEEFEMQLRKHVFIALLIALMVCFCFSTHAEDIKLTLEVPETTLAAGTTIKVNPSLSDETIKKVKYVWETSDKKVASVSNGSVRAVGEGTATITCSTTIDDKTIQESFTVNVYVPVKSVSIKQKNVTLEVGDSKRMEVTINPKNASNKNLTWKSDNPSIATVNENGRIEAIYGGTCTVTGTTNDGSNKSVSVSVFVPSMSCSVTERYLTLGQDTKFSVYLYTNNKNAIIVDDKNAQNNHYYYEINDDKIDFRIIPWYAGQSTLTITDPNSPKSTIKIKLITTPDNGLAKGYHWVQSDNDYRDWLRGYSNSYVRVGGYVRQIEYSGNQVWMLITSKGRYENLVYANFIIPDGSSLPRILEGDHIGIYGKAIGTYTYTTVMNTSNTVPQIDPMLIETIDDGNWIYAISNYYTNE